MLGYLRFLSDVSCIVQLIFHFCCLWASHSIRSAAKPFLVKKAMRHTFAGRYFNCCQIELLRTVQLSVQIYALLLCSTALNELHEDLVLSLKCAAIIDAENKTPRKNKCRNINWWKYLARWTSVQREIELMF